MRRELRTHQEEDTPEVNTYSEIGGAEVSAEWIDVLGYEGKYQVSSDGQVRSLDRLSSHGRRIRGVMLSQMKLKGYPAVHLSKNGNIKMCTVHRLVATAFLPASKGRTQVNHKNGIKTDNRVENLEWCTPSENERHSYRVLKKKSRRNWKGGPEHAYIGEGNGIKVKFRSHAELEKAGYSGSAVSRCANGRSKTSGGLVWRYA